jgi:membrane protein
MTQRDRHPAVETVAAGERHTAGGARPDTGPTDLDRGTWWEVLKRTVREFQADNPTDGAAALPYYGVPSLFPALTALFSIVGLVGSSATDPLVDNLATFAPGPALES